MATVMVSMARRLPRASSLCSRFFLRETSVCETSSFFTTVMPALTASLLAWPRCCSRSCAASASVALSPTVVQMVLDPSKWRSA